MTAKAAKATTKKTKTTKPKAATTSKPKTSAVEKPKTSAANRPKTTVQPVSKNPVVKDEKKTLSAWNLRLGVVLAVEAAVVVALGGTKTVQLTTQYLTTDTLASDLTGSGVRIFATATRHLADVPVSWLVAAFLLAFGATFILLATVWRKHYETWLERGVNKMRWLGFGLGGGLMAVLVAMLSGISDLGYLLLIFASLAVLGSLSTIVELIGTERRLRKFIIFTAIATVALPVVAIGLTTLGVVLYDGSLPMYLYFVYSSMLLFAAAVTLSCILRLRRRGKWSDTMYTERAFMLLGFGAATVLALQIFAGALQS